MNIWEQGDYYRYSAFIRDTERRYALPRNLLALVLYQASRFDPDVIAGKGQHPLSAIGIAKLAAKDALELWNEQPADYSQRFDPPTMRKNPHASIIGCARLLKQKHSRFRNWRFALLAYHTSDDIAQSALRKGTPLPIDAADYVAQITSQVRV